MHNPFEQQHNIYIYKFITQFKFVEQISSNWEDNALYINSYEAELTTNVTPEDEDKWFIDLALSNKINSQKLLDLLPENIEIKFLERQHLEDQDWLTHVANHNNVFKVRDYKIINKTDYKITNLNQIKLQAARAFGSGEHQTTSLCIKAINKLNFFDKKINVLDVGTGSGILAIICAKKFANYNIINASDIDQVATEYANNNIKHNLSNGNIKAVKANGLNNRLIAQHKYDLIVANILAKPIILLSLQIENHLKQGGYLIISGIIDKQVNLIKNQFKSLQMIIDNYQIQDNWAQITFKKITN